MFEGLIATQSMTAGTSGTIDVYYAAPPLLPETPIARARRLSNHLADFCGRLMESGYDFDSIEPYAEAADELSRLADILSLTYFVPDVEPTLTWTC